MFTYFASICASVIISILKNDSATSETRKAFVHVVTSSKKIAVGSEKNKHGMLFLSAPGVNINIAKQNLTLCKK